MTALPPVPIRLNTIVPRPLHWLWRPRIPAGRLSLLVGHPDRGKTVILCTCAAHVSHALPWPDGALCPVGDVILLEAEDSLDETIVPRLMAAGADLSRILTYSARTLVQLPDMVQELHPRLVLLSPLNTYLPKLNTWNDQDVRKELQPLADLAAHTGTAILGVMHPPKTKHALPIHVIAGSVAFGAVARSVLTAERGHDGLYLLEAIKQNLAHTIPPIGYRIRPWADNPDVAQLVWECVPETLSFAPPDDEQSALTEACEFVKMALKYGMVTSRHLKAGADREGIAWRTIMRARKVLRVRASQICKGGKSSWELRLPRSNIPLS